MLLHCHDVADGQTMPGEVVGSFDVEPAVQVLQTVNLIAVMVQRSGVDQLIVIGVRLKPLLL